MIQINKLKAAKKFPVGYFIQEQLDLRNWTQGDLAEILAVSEKHLSNVMLAKKPVSFEMAKLLGKVFSTSVKYWLNLDTDYRLWLENENSKKEIDTDTKTIIYERMPILDMIKKGWLKKPLSTEDLVEQVLAFWKIKRLDFSWLDTQILPFLTRKSESYNQFNASYAATWYHMARNVAKQYNVPPYKKENLEKLYGKLHSFTVTSDGIDHFLNELNKTGVKFFVLPHLQKTYLDGAAFLDGKNPTIVYTGRLKRIDNFWFTVAHEIAHILLHLDKNTPFVLDNFKGGSKNKMEDEANNLAAEKLKHTEIETFLSPYEHYLTTSKVEECAHTYQVHPSIIMGKLAHEDKISYRRTHLYSENVLNLIKKDFTQQA